MNSAFKLVLILMIGFVLTMSTACAQREVEFFHGGYPRFEPGPPGGVDWVDIKKGVDFKAYKTVIMDPVYFRFDSSAQYNAVPPHALRELRETFNTAFINALKDGYPLVKQARPDAMRVRVAIINLIPLVQDSSTSNVPFSVGGASIKAEILDSITSERLAAAMDTKTGYEGEAVKSMDEWQHTKDVFYFWAQRLRKWLDTNRGVK